VELSPQEQPGVAAAMSMTLAKGGSRLAYSNMSPLGPAGLAMPYDTTPHLPPAGLGGEQGSSLLQTHGEREDSAEKTLKPDTYNKPPPTPDYMKKWRKDMCPGKVVLHPGYSSDTDHERLAVYGRPEPVGVKVHEVLNTAPKSELIDKAIDKKESIYLSHKREPLGTGYLRGHELPADLQYEKGFGRPTPQDVSGDASKGLLHPLEKVHDPVEHDLYVRSHANYAPGEQRHRGYTWVDQGGKIDPGFYAFGADIKAREIEGVAKSLNPKIDPNSVPPAVVVEKRLEEFRDVHTEPLAAVKSVGHGHITTHDRVFGMPSQKGPEWGVRECIGSYPIPEQAPDTDLGRSIRPGWRNVQPDGRTFGTPTIRSDIAAPSLKSVADHQNYGDEVTADALLYPPRFADGGVSSDDFLEARSQQDIADIFASAGLQMSDEELASTYAKAAQLDPKGLVSIESFRRTLNS